LQVADILVGLVVIDGFGSDKRSDCNIITIKCFSPLNSTFHFLSVLFRFKRRGVIDVTSEGTNYTETAGCCKHLGVKKKSYAS